MLVATNSIARRTTESNIVPRIPASNAVTILHRFSQHPLRKSADETRVTARYATATPKTTHKNAGVRVITAVILKNAVIIPIIRLATIAITVQLVLQLLHVVDINFHPLHHFMLNCGSGERKSLFLC